MLSVDVAGIGCVLPGLADWPATRAVLAGTAARVPGPLPQCTPTTLPAAERRRAGPFLRLALAVAQEAVAAARLDPAQLASVFASADGDGENVHAICSALAADEALSPTRFHNSVQNAASGYWTIATGAQAPTTMINAGDGVFATALLEAAVQVVAEGRPVLVVASDLPMPPPLHALHPVAAGGGVSLALAPRGLGTARLDIALVRDRTETRFTEPALETLRVGGPAGRALALLAPLARGAAAEIVLAFEAPHALAIRVAPAP